MSSVDAATNPSPITDDVREAPSYLPTTSSPPPRRRALGIISCVVVPAVADMFMLDNPENLLTGIGLFGNMAVAPYNSTFTNGFLVDPPPATVCAGRGDERLPVR